MQTPLLLVFLSWVGASGHAADAIPEDSALVQLLHADGDVLTVKWDSAGVGELRQSKPRFVLEGIPISATRRVDLELTPFSVAGPDTRFVLGREGAPDEPFVFDTSRVRAFRGRVKDQAGSEVLVVFGDVQTTGYIDLGTGRKRFLLSSKDRNGIRLPHGITSIFPAGNVAGYHPPVPFCGVNQTILPLGTKPVHDAGVPSVGSEPARGIRHVELAVESDYAYFTLFGDRGAATEYLVQMYAQVSHIFLRDARARLELVLVRLWDAPIATSRRLVDDGKLGGIAFGGPVAFDVAQFVSGSRGAPYGGIAGGGLCGSGVASEIYYVQGFFSDPTIPSPYLYDIFVAAHELGHNAGAPHTHAAGIDNCANPSATPQRGTIMSYCQQTYSGLNANQDLYFHRLIAAGMIGRFQSAYCVVEDCNLNDDDDALDILGGASADVNRNGVPDECEDCNNNGVLDDEDVASQTSDDINANGIPDECEPDCNGNGIPDLTDIVDGASSDLYGNAVPDECETDCNGNDVSDYTEIQGDMSKDVDRNAALDECQDCDNDGTTDHAALNGAHNLWIASGLPAAPVREFFATTGVLVRASTAPLVSVGQDVVIAPDGRILVSSAGTNRIQAYDRSARFIEDFVPPGTLGLSFPTGMLVLADGRLLVASRNTDNVLAFDATTGAPLGEFVSAGSGGLYKPYGLTVGPDGNLFVASETNEIIEYDGLDGSFVRVFVSAPANGGLLQPRDLVFKRDGQLLVTSHGTDQVLEYDGQSGAPIGSWAVLGWSVSGMTPAKPWGIEIGPNGNVFVSRALSNLQSTSDAGTGGEPLHLSDAKVFEYDVCNGNFVRVHVGGGDLDLSVPTGFAFIPGWDHDCNFNLVPDACDTASGASFDLNGNQVPDECEIDCNGNGRLDRLDVIPFGPSLDCNNNLTPDECDIAAGTSTDFDGSGVPDECEPDCNGIAPIDSCGFDTGSEPDCDGNGQPDSREILEATAADCNANCIPDICEPDFDADGVIDDCDDDTDDDGVPNELDLCDFTPLGQPVTDDGCPARGACCFQVGVCVENTDTTDCASVGGTYQGHRSTCKFKCVFPCDFDGDNDVDLVDSATFVRCLTGPTGAAAAGCQAGDPDNDHDVDLGDVAVLQNLFTGELAVCGDGILHPDEACDDGNTTPGDGCDENCQIEPGCGNGIVEAGEQCDDNGTDPGDGCDETCQLEPGANNYCRYPLTVDAGTISFTNEDATTDGPDDPGPCALEGTSQIDADVWFLLTSPCTDDVIVSVCGADFDTKAAVYDGAECPSSLSIACSDDDCGPGLGSRLSFPAQAGNSYLIRVGGFEGDTGTATLTIYCHSDPNFGVGTCGVSEGDCFTQNDGPGCVDAECCLDVCAIDPFCCDTQWDATCVEKAEEIICRDTPPEACGPGAGDCNDPAGNGTPGCEDPDCCQTVCESDPFCCLTEWDDICAFSAEVECGSFQVCEVATGDCGSAQTTPGCAVESCCRAVCSVDPACCTGAWDDLCVERAATTPECQ